jgi:hypothetical protein
VLAVAAVLILAALGAYWNSFNVPFLLDDTSAISENTSIRHLGRIGDILLPPSTVATAARPLLILTLALNFAESGLSVRGYHVSNLLIHICAALTLLGNVRRTLLLPGLRHRYGEAALPLAAFAALQQTAVGGSNRWLCLSVFACFCEMATKQVMVTVPVLVLLHDRAFVSGADLWASHWRKFAEISGRR